MKYLPKRAAAVLLACACMPRAIPAAALGSGYPGLYALCRTADRADYAALSDAEFANFRAVTAGDIAEGVLYRSSSPVDPTLGRSDYADAEAEKAGIRTVLNLAENQTVAEAYPGYAESYYSGCDIYFADMTTVYASEPFRVSLAGSLRYLSSHEGPYLIHCMEGRLRTGVTCALLECLMGADLEAVQDDFAVTYENYYHVVNGVKQPLPAELMPTVRSLIVGFLAEMYGEPPEEDDLAAQAEAYIRRIGLTDSDIAQIRQNLSAQPAAAETTLTVSGNGTETTQTTVTQTTVTQTAASETAAAVQTDAPSPQTGESGGIVLIITVAAGIMLYLLPRRTATDKNKRRKLL